MDEFIKEIWAYAAACGVKPTTVIQNAGCGGGLTWQKWQDGGTCSMRTADKLRDYMAENPIEKSTEDAA